ncbi:hypothetical protein F3087_40280 [Nocardia colli]|uniref:Uncharacterized protein n=1 Tax=Nocardia colli TaxID=2545717 RepID=A0A5N0DYY3_9NOCA|nr:type VII secretion target [Nocardia colli]KAA8881906.1 hypothetical protein F3087_40280 [Nocardia colli]
MPDSMEIEPSVLRELALQHDQVARDTREWAKPPTHWLDTFESTYGKIADPVHQALIRYYEARQRAGNALAKEHDDTAAALRSSADAYEHADAEIGSFVSRTAEPFVEPSPAAPFPANGAAPSVPAAEANGSRAASAPNGAAPVGNPLSAAQQPAAEHPIDGAAAKTDSAGTPTAGPVSAPISAGAPPGPPVGVDAGPMPSYGTGADRAEPPGPAGPAPHVDATLIPVLPPFLAAARAARDRAAEPAHVVNEADNEDLIIAQTLLGGILAATETTAVGLDWAVAVVRGAAGAGIFVTSNEGRGWLPAGLFLPNEVSTPWMWDGPDGLLGADIGDGGSPWEGVADPARVLAEFGLVWGGKTDSRLSALASSAPLAADLRTQLSDVAMAANVGPVYELDLRVFTPDTTDRLGLAGSPAAVESTATVPDSGVRARCVQLAADAHNLMGRAGSAAAAADSRRLRERILALAEVGQEISTESFDELADANDLLVAEMLPLRVDAHLIELGALRVDDRSSILRALVFERRCNELVLLLAGEPTRQCLRDAVYAHEQIVGHPQFVEAPAAVVAADAGRVAQDAARVAGSAVGGKVTPPSDVAPPRVTPESS